MDDLLGKFGLKEGIVCGTIDGGLMIKNAYKPVDRLSSLWWSGEAPRGPVELVAFELEKNCAFLAVHHQIAKPGGGFARFGSPLVVSVPGGSYTRAELYRVVLEKLKGVNRKHRVTFYYLLAEATGTLGKLS